MSIEKSLTVFGDVIESFWRSVPDGFVRGYLSTVFECPYSGRVSPDVVADLSSRLLGLGVDELSLGDTIGVASPAEVTDLVHVLGQTVDLAKVTMHFHDTWGMAIANIAAAYDAGIRSFDASAGGLGGCPFAPGAGGNLSLIHI